MFVHQPALETLGLKKHGSTDYVFSWKSKGMSNSKLKPLRTSFLHSRKHFGYRIGINLMKIL